MGKEFYIRILKPVPEKFCKNRIFDENEVVQAGLDYDYATELRDKYHVKIRLQSAYVSMDDVREYLKPKMPEADFGSWGMGQTYMGYHCHGKYMDGRPWAYDLSKQEYEALKKVHVNDAVVMKCVDSFSVADYDSKWLTGKCPAYITKKFLNSISVCYMAHLNNMDKDELRYRIEEPGSCSKNLFAILHDVFSYAGRIGGIGYIEWE